MPRKEILRTTPDYEFHVVGGPRPNLADLYHMLLRMRWSHIFLLILVVYTLINILFATVYVFTGGIQNAEPGSFLDAFFFSVQTMGTIGYGAMVPVTRLANTVVFFESVTGLVVTALATGLVFVRFSLTRARVMFSKKIAYAPVDGVPTIMVRIGNERRNQIIDATFRMTFTRSTKTAEGVFYYQSRELPLMRNRASALARSWQIMHKVTPDSPFYGETPESLKATDAEILVELVGIDDTSLQPSHARHSWMYHEIAWGARLTDVISEQEGGRIVLLDLTKFHDVDPTPKTDDFPYGT
jgi:inward rectifier potassium channel